MVYERLKLNVKARAGAREKRGGRGWVGLTYRAFCATHPRIAHFIYLITRRVRYVLCITEIVVDYWSGLSYSSYRTILSRNY